MPNELKPCKKCANDKLSKYFCQYPPLYYIECPKCGHKSKSCVYEADATKDWNQRPVEDTLRAELEKTQRALEEATKLICSKWKCPPNKPCDTYDEWIKEHGCSACWKAYFMSLTPEQFGAEFGGEDK